jgi:uncharacterized membrane protein
MFLSKELLNPKKSVDRSHPCFPVAFCRTDFGLQRGFQVRSGEHMESNAVTQSVELIVQGLEILGIAVIGIAFPYATIRGLMHIRQRKLDAYQQLKIFIGKALQLGLEFLVAADIIRTVTIEPTREGIVSLGLLILVRTFLSWSITVEIEGCWPWQIARTGRA